MTLSEYLSLLDRWAAKVKVGNVCPDRLRRVSGAKPILASSGYGKPSFTLKSSRVARPMPSMFQNHLVLEQ